jgi:tetratricopeptide (TPR) repeat protein
MQPASHIITAGVEGEESWILNEKSLFTAAFLAAARGALSMPSDGVISLSEIMVQINRALDVKRAEQNDNFKMTPRSYYTRIENNAGEFFFLPNSIPRSNNPSPSVSAALERKSDIPPNSVQAYLSRGVEYGEKNNIDGAIAEFSEAIRLDPKHTLAFYNRGKAYLLKKDYDRAIADYTEAIRLDPRYAQAFTNRGNAYAGKKDYDLAIADYTEVIRLDPKRTLAFSNRGTAYVDKKDYDRAIADYTEAIRLDPRNADFFVNRGAAYAIRGFTAIKPFTSPGLAYTPSPNAYTPKDDTDLAIDDFNEAIRLNPNHALAFCNRGRTKLKINDASGEADIAEARQLDASICR